MEGRTKATWRLLNAPKVAPKINENRLWDEINALKTRVRVLGQSLERLEQRVSAASHQQSGLATAIEGKGKQETAPALATLYDNPLPTQVNNPTSEGSKELSPRYKNVAAGAGTQDSRHEGGDKAVMPSTGGQQARDSATADKAEEKVESNIAERPAPTANAVRESSPRKEEVVEFYSNCAIQ